MRHPRFLSLVAVGLLVSAGLPACAVDTSSREEVAPSEEAVATTSSALRASMLTPSGEIQLGVARGVIATRDWRSYTFACPPSGVRVQVTAQGAPSADLLLLDGNHEEIAAGVPVREARIVRAAFASSPNGRCHIALRGSGENVLLLVGESSPRASAEHQAVLDTVERAIARVRGRIAELEADITSLEQQHAWRQYEADWYVNAIAQRQREVQAQYDRDRQNALLFCLFGYCNVGVVSLAMAYDNDARLRELNTQLANARRSAADLRRQIATYQQRRDALRARLATLRSTEDRLLDALDVADSTPLPALSPEVAESPEAARAAVRAQALGRVKTNLDEQVAVLLEIRTIASELARDLDRSVEALRQASLQADRFAAESREAFHGLLELAVFGDAVAAERWLEDWASRKTKAFLRDLGWDPNALGDRIVRQSGVGSGPAQEALRGALADALRV
jgi:TolA-binding protein